MAVSSLLALLDDVATILDDVAILAKVAAKKTTGVLGDDLALNAQQVAGIRAERELPVVWAVAKGSARNKLILVPLALLISRFAPWLVVPLLMLGGAYLCLEGFEKVVHSVSKPSKGAVERDAARLRALADPDLDLVALEREKIRGAVRTDFVLSAEIVTISLGIVASAPFASQVLVLTVIAALMTVGVYGFVALIVKLDDMGLHLQRKQGIGTLARSPAGLGQRPPRLGLPPHERPRPGRHPRHVPGGRRHLHPRRPRPAPPQGGGAPRDLALAGWPPGPGRPSPGGPPGGPRHRRRNPGGGDPGAAPAKAPPRVNCAGRSDCQSKSWTGTHGDERG